MSKPNNIDLASLTSPLGTPANEEVAELQKQYLLQQLRIGQLQEYDLGKKRALAEEQESMAKEARRQGAINTAQKAEREALIQQACPHLKPNFTPAIGGQRDSKGTSHWICAYCSKTWINNELPVHLRIPSDRVGGPEVYSHN